VDVKPPQKISTLVNAPISQSTGDAFTRNRALLLNEMNRHRKAAAGGGFANESFLRLTQTLHTALNCALAVVQLERRPNQFSRMD
jgi:hypothetical protein